MSTEKQKCLFKEYQNRPAEARKDRLVRAPKTAGFFPESAFLTDSRTGSRKENKRKRSSEGSLSAEAAFVLPLFVMIFAAVFSLFTAVLSEIRLTGAMSEALRSLAEDNSGISAEAAGRFLQSELAGSTALPAGDMTVQADGTGAFGTGGTEYRITAGFRTEVPFFRRFIRNLSLKKTLSRRSLSGKFWENAEGERPVYLTVYGSVYHTSLSCSYLRISVQEVSFSEISTLRNRDGKIYYPCESCASGSPRDRVLVTTYGTRWHSDRSCAGLRRGILRVSLSEAGGLPMCSRCREMEGASHE